MMEIGVWVFIFFILAIGYVMNLTEIQKIRNERLIIRLEDKAKIKRLESFNKWYGKLLVGIPAAIITGLILGEI